MTPRWDEPGGSIEDTQSEDTGLRARKVHQQAQTMRKEYREWKRTSPKVSITKRQRMEQWEREVLELAADQVALWNSTARAIRSIQDGTVDPDRRHEIQLTAQDARLQALRRRSQEDLEGDPSHPMFQALREMDDNQQEIFQAVGDACDSPGTHPDRLNVALSQAQYNQAQAELAMLNTAQACREIEKKHNQTLSRQENTSTFVLLVLISLLALISLLVLLTLATWPETG